MVTGTCLNKRIKEIDVNGKEILVVSGENPYPGSNDHHGGEVGIGRRGKEKGELGSL